MLLAQRISLVRDRLGAWPIVAVVFLGSGIAIGATNYAFGLFLEPLQNEFGWQRTAISASLSFAALNSLTSPIQGRIMDRFGARPLIVFAMVSFGLSYVLRPFMTELWHLYVLSVFQYVAFAGATNLPAGRLVGIWFPHARGRVMGITTTGNNFGGLIIPLITAFALGRWDWKAAYVVTGVMAFGLALAALMIVREKPRSQPAVKAATRPELTGWSVKDAVRTRAFYAMTIGMMLGYFTYSSLLPQVGAHLKAEGVPQGAAVAAVGLLAIFGMMGKLSFGWLAERFTARRAMMASMTGQALFITALAFLPSAPFFWVFTPLFGFCMGGFGVLVTLIVQENFGLKYFGSISGLSTLANILPLVTGPLIAGASYDITGSYATAFIATAALFAIGVVILLQMGRRTSLPSPLP
ncbi:MAG: MFS transporter [SAR202 cluster bacterium]|nr:MFS transporter [SAR202 cluster bacterium]